MFGSMFGAEGGDDAVCLWILLAVLKKNGVMHHTLCAAFD